MNPFLPEMFFDLEGQRAADLFRSLNYVWEAVAALPSFIEKMIQPEVLGEVEEGAWLEPNRVQLGKGSRVERGAIVRGPTIIGENTVIRTGAYIRGHVMVGDQCMIGHGTETRQTLVLNGSNIPHLNCFFTSLVGNRVRIGGNVHTANFRLKGEEVIIKVDLEGKKQLFPTGQTLLGVIVGDDASIGGNSLCQPGSLVGRRTIIHPFCSVIGYIPPDSIMRPKGITYEVVSKKER